ncbi:MAG TPA: hypothetical protein VGG59_10150 [Acidobacteriaceae bacterium]
MSSDENLQHPPPGNGTKNKRYEIEWRYSPSDFFPAPISEQLLDCDAKIAQGAAIACIDPELYESNPSLHTQLHQILDARCRVQQYKTGKAYDLDGGTLTEYHWNGHRAMHASSFMSSTSSMTVDFTVTDSRGKTIFDSAAERQRKKLKHEQKKLDLQQLDAQVAAALEQHYRKGSHPENPLLDSLLASHLSACSDPDNELVYLYELRDALAKRFRSESKARKILSVSNAEWSRFGRLSNNEPVSQGRHRGKFLGELRSATDEELVEARTFARRLLLGFLQYLKRAGPPA